MASVNILETGVNTLIQELSYFSTALDSLILQSDTSDLEFENENENNKKILNALNLNCKNTSTDTGKFSHKINNDIQSNNDMKTIERLPPPPEDN